MPRTKGSGNRIQCSFPETNISKLPKSILYLPEGSHKIFATVNGEPKEVEVHVDSSILASFAQGLKSRLERKTRSITDFDHAGKGPASSIPSSFRYKEGKGLMLDVEWTSAGRASVEGKDYNHFSPDFLLGAGGIPTGIAKRGPLGSLTNDPAFEEIGLVAATKAKQETNSHTPIMSELSKCGLLTENEAAKDDAAQVAAARVTALKAEPDAAKVEASKAFQKHLKDAAKAADISDENLSAIGVSAAFASDASSDDIAKACGTLLIQAASQHEQLQKSEDAAAGAFVSAAVAAGKIPEKNEELKAFWKKNHLDNSEAAVSAMKAQPKIAEGLQDKIVKASNASSGGLEDAKAELVKAGRAKTDAEATALAIKESPELYKEYREQNF